MPKIGSSLLSAFPRIKGVCVRDTALSVVQHIAEVSLNQLILSGVSALISKASFLSSFVPVDNRFPSTSAAICYLNNARMGIVKLTQL